MPMKPLEKRKQVTYLIISAISLVVVVWYQFFR